MFKKRRARTFPCVSPGRLPGNKSPGFSLLEMLIVLAIMAGMMAMVWPNLQRPLQRAALNDAASILRSVLDESRYQAMIMGEIWLVRLELDSRQLSCGGLACYSQQSELDSLDDRQPTIHQLPFPVYIAEVIWSPNPLHSEYGDPTVEGAIEVLSPSFLREPRPPASTVKWVPLLASGRSRDVSVRLADATTGQSIWVVFLEATGTVETL